MKRPLVLGSILLALFAHSRALAEYPQACYWFVSRNDCPAWNCRDGSGPCITRVWMQPIAYDVPVTIGTGCGVTTLNSIMVTCALAHQFNALCQPTQVPATPEKVPSGTPKPTALACPPGCEGEDPPTP